MFICEFLNLLSFSVMGAHPKRILLVEDHDDTRKMLTVVLRRRGYAVSAVGTKAEAMRVCEAEGFDLLIGDVQLPDGSGLDLMRDLAAICNIKGIAFTGYGRQEDVDAARAAGFSVHLLKPAELDTLFKTIEQVLSEADVPARQI